MKEASTVWDLDSTEVEVTSAEVKKKSKTRVTKKAKEARVSRAYARACSGVQVDIMDLGKIFNVGMLAVEEGADDTELEKRLAAFVETIRKN